MAQPLELRLRITGDGSNLGATLRDAEGNIVRLGQSGTAAGERISTGMTAARRGVVGISQQLTTMRSLVAGLVGVNIGIGMAKQLVGDAAAVQDLQTRLRTLVPDAQAYADVQAYLGEVSRDQHKDVNVLTDSYARLRTLQNSGLLTDKQTKSVLEGMSNAASALGVNNAQLGQSFYGLSQALSSGVVHAEEFNQVTEPMPGLMQKLDDALGEGAGGMRRLVNEGKVTSEMFSKYLVTALQSYDGAAAASGKNINATFADLKNEYTRLVTELEGPISGALLPVAKELAATVRNLASSVQELKGVDLSGIGGNLTIPIGAYAGFRAGALTGNPYLAGAGLVAGTVGGLYAATTPGQRPDLSFAPGKTGPETLRNKLAAADTFIGQVNRAVFSGKEVKDNAVAAALGDKSKLQQALIQALQAAAEKSGFPYTAANANEQARVVDVNKQLGAEANMGAKIRLVEEHLELSGHFIAKMEAAIKAAEAAVAPAVKAPAKPELYQAAEKKYRLPPFVLQAVAKTESDNGLNAGLSPTGALGLMQLTPATATRFGVKDRADDAQSIDGAAQYLRFLLDKFNGNLEHALAGYNAGEGATAKALKATGAIPNNKETQAYIPKVLAELDKLQNNSGGVSLVEQFKTTQTFFKNQREAAATINESRIGTRLKTAETTAQNTIESLKVLKEQGKVGITEYYQALTVQQESVVKANIGAVKARLAEAERQGAQAQATAKPEELPQLAADFEAKKAALTSELQSFELKLQQIAPANLIDRDQEQHALDDVVAQVKIKLAELRGETARDPVAIKARLELENADIIGKLRQAGQGDLAGQYLNTLSGTEQANVIQTDISRVQQRTQVQETRINLLQQSGTTTQFHAQQELKQLYQDSADELDAMADKMTELGSNTGLEAVKIKALEAKNAAVQSRVTLPSLTTKFIDAGQTAAITAMTDGLVGLTSGAQSAGAAFTHMGLSIVKAIQAIAAEQLAKQIIGTVVSLAGAALGINTGNTGNTGVASAIGAYLSRADGGLITGPGTGTSDSINTALPAGSFVIKAASVKRLGLPALAALTKGSGAQPVGAALAANGNKIPVKVSNQEFWIAPSMVAKHGRAFFEHINKNGMMPPASIQRAYASGGLVGGQPVGATSAAPAANTRDTINISVPVHVNQADGKGANDGNKLDPNKMNELGKRLKAMVADEIAQQQRPGGLLYRGR